MSNNEVTIGRLNSDLGKDYAKMLRASALVEIADWASIASEYMKDSRDVAEQADSALYYDLECLLRKVAEHAHVRSN